MPDGFHHVLLYGPPAAGKRTVGLALAHRTGFALLDNTLTIEVAHHLFAFGAPGFWALVSRLRTDLLEAAGANGRSVITTFVYGPGDERFVEHQADLVGRLGGTVHRVQLLPSAEALLARVVQPSRVGHKLTRPETLADLLPRVTGLIDPDDLCIDNTDLAPQAVVELICAHFDLPCLPDQVPERSASTGSSEAARSDG